MTRWQRLQKMSETELAIFIYGFLCSNKWSASEMCTVGGMIGWLQGEWIDGEYGF